MENFDGDFDGGAIGHLNIVLYRSRQLQIILQKGKKGEESKRRGNRNTSKEEGGRKGGTTVLFLLLAPSLLFLPPTSPPSFSFVFPSPCCCDCFSGPCTLSWSKSGSFTSFERKSSQPNSNCAKMPSSSSSLSSVVAAAVYLHFVLVEIRVID